MDALSRSHARARAYRLFGRIFRQGLTQRWLGYVRDIEPLARVLPRAFDADEAAAAHYSLFGLNVFPYESVFRDAQAMMGGPSSEAAADFYAHVGFGPAAQDEAPDHVGVELELLAFLCAAEADAIEDAQTLAALRMQNFQRAFLDEHLLVWLPALAQAIRQQNAPFYAALADLTLELALDHRRDLDDDLLSPPPSSFPASASPSASSLLQDPKTGLREIADYLVVPASSGFYLSRDDIRGLSRRGKLPSGFGDRRLMLTNLMRSAAAYDEFDALIAALDDLAQTWQVMYDELAAAIPAVAEQWRRRLSDTRTLLKTIKSQQPIIND